MSPFLRRVAWFATAALVVPILSWSPATPATAGTTFVVDTAAGSASYDTCSSAPGDCSLGGAIGVANATPGADVIQFAIPGGECPSGVCRITLTAGGFHITEAVDIDATTQPQNGAPYGNVCAAPAEHPHLKVEVMVDAGLDNNVFYIDHATGSTQIRGFAFGTSIPSAGAGIAVVDGSGHHISCNHFSLDGDGAATLGTGSFIAGVSIASAASDVTIGTDGDGVDDEAERNVFGPGPDMTVYASSSINTVVAGNYFGLSADGSTMLGAGTLRLQDNCQGSTIGTNRDGVSDEVERNYFAGDDPLLVASAVFDDDDVKIVGNTFGLTTLGDEAITYSAIRVDGLATSTTGFEISDNSFGLVETGIVLDAVGGEVIVSGNTMGGEFGGAPISGFTAIRAGGSASYEIRDNLIQNSQSVGILIEDDASFDSASRDNCLIGNDVGVGNTSGDGVYFSNNWWGDGSGPSGFGPGTGDEVAELVGFEPWLTAPPAQCNTSPVASDANFVVAEDVAVGTTVGTVTATDDGDDVSFAITAGNTGGAFSVDGDTGVVSVARTLDYETTPAYVLTVTASDPFLSDTASVAVVVTDVADGPRFTDVPIGHTFYGDIDWLAIEGITRGCNPPVNDLFCPDASVTRGQMAAFLHRALDGVLTPGTTVEFVDDGSVFDADIEWLGAVGVTRGCNPPTNDMYCPDAPVTRGQMAAFLVRALDLPAATGIDFVDDDDSIFETDIEKLAMAGITRGCNPPTNDRFCPDDPVTRAQMAAFLHRALGD